MSGALMPHTTDTLTHPPGTPIPEKVMSPTVDEIRRTAEARLDELKPLLAEAAQLQSLLAALDTNTSMEWPAADEVAPMPVRAARSSHRPGRPSTLRGRDGRAPQGSNKRVILDIVADHPGIAAPAIAALTGMKRTVIASTISRLKRTGELEPEGAGVRIPRAARVA
ncbi:hypothetical protein Q5424_17215 [Conexibacter sp. JD483]|uniref:hypothetical protein n=1 Tax=unclassified Conexibacter TaxID=2627773 RepID=UPI0027176FAA|nr:MULTISPECIES: hypothetical protein [unclassified Conexibacter]MDO8188667.1 hypothetical protein [Conexibacter sp. CPCC 205706]MDO8199360.1 hypothetical protein [Conexibacter sp. CPCC 205762]MDR9370840.1 hypothetical protein [Conexibacter sp. JD483]